MTLALPNLPLFERAIGFAKEEWGPAIVDASTGKSHSYRELVHAAATLRNTLLKEQSDLNEQRIAVLCPSGFLYVVCQWAVWASGGVFVPLCTTHPAAEQCYTIEDSQASLIVSHPDLKDRAEMLSHQTADTPVLVVEPETLLSKQEQKDLPNQLHMDRSRRAMILYTSGTTGKPKGVVTTHDNIDAQIRVLVDAWYWTRSDRIHHILPLHHVHGIINALSCALYAGATVEMYPKFNASEVWERWLQSAPSSGSTDLETENEGSDTTSTSSEPQPSPSSPPLTIFMSVPTVYAKLIQHYKTLDESVRHNYSVACKQFRFMVSGSASLPTPLRDTWRRISSGQVLLERYGMTEIGMALSQPYEIQERVEGTVGFPLPGVQVRLMAETEEGSGIFDKDITDTRELPGIVQVKGDNVFKEYWQRPEATSKEFTADGWFITGDYGTRVSQQGYYKILGRASSDIIKTGGEKVSALEIERELLSCSLNIEDVAVIGLSDPEWGQRVAAVVVMESGKEDLDLQTMRNTLKTRLAVYKVPQLLKVVKELPKNAMGKVTKKALNPLFD